MEFVEEVVFEWVKSNCVVQNPYKPWVVSPLSYSTNKFILDLRVYNNFLWKRKVLFEVCKIVLKYFEKDSFCFKFDLSEGYNYINIFSGHQTFLGFYDGSDEKL